MSAVSELAKREGIEINFIVKCSSWSAVADVLSGRQAAGILPSTMQSPEGFKEVSVPGLKGFERTLALAWDARRGNLRERSSAWQRVLCDVLCF
jgi:hypothetical protein